MEFIAEQYQLLVSMFLFAVPIILALVQFLKDALELEGKIVMWMSFLVGIVLSGLFAVAYLVPAAQIYITIVFFVLASGLVASGFYSFGTRLTQTTHEKIE